MTQQQLVSAAGVTVATVNYAENGLTRPKIATIRKTCSNDTYHFGVGRRLENLPLLHDKLFAINDRMP